MKKLFNKSKGKEGFTLVELLIVIVILGILAAIVIARFAGATKDSKEANLKGNLRTIRAALETYKANSKSNSYPGNLDQLWVGSIDDVDSKTFLERIPIDPFHRSKATAASSGVLLPTDDATGRNGKITGGGGWAYDSINGRICANYYTTDTTVGDPTDTTWGSEYCLW